jgi:hypothetical protein
MTRRTLLLFSIIVLFACREESRRVSEPSNDVPSAPGTSQTPTPDTSSASPEATVRTEPGAKEAVSILEAYYAAINRRDYERAHRYWSGDGSASGQSLEQFRKGFADTAAVEIQIGTPGRIDPAAGSRYIEIPIEITATTIAGKTQRFRGNYVLRRSVVDGATAEQRQWRINSAKIARVSS